MSNGKFDLGKVKGGVSWIERFARHHMVETLTMAAILLGAFSAWSHMFIGTLGWSVAFLVVGSALGIFLPRRMDHLMKWVYSFSREGSPSATFVAEGIKIAIALFLPFLYFGFLGIMTGTAYQYYSRISQSGQKGNNKAA